MSRIKFSRYDEDHLVMVLVLPNELLRQIGITEETETSLAFFQDEIRIYKRRDVKEMGIEFGDQSESRNQN